MGEGNEETLVKEYNKANKFWDLMYGMGTAVNATVLHT